MRSQKEIPSFIYMHSGLRLCALPYVDGKEHTTGSRRVVGAIYE